MEPAITDGLHSGVTQMGRSLRAKGGEKDPSQTIAEITRDAFAPVPYTPWPVDEKANKNRPSRRGLHRPISSPPLWALDRLGQALRRRLALLRAPPFWPLRLAPLAEARQHQR